MPSTNIDATRLTPASVPSTTPAAAVSKAPEVTTSASVDALSATPNPPRFPWLSNLGNRLAEQSKQRPPFTAAPVIGDNVDLKA